MTAVRRYAPAALLCVALLAPACAWNSDVARPIDDAAAAQSSKIYASDGTLITTLHSEENRETVTLERMAKPLVDAVVAVEDRRFWDHKGVDLRAVLRAAYTDASEGRVVEGGSTITQQYVKNVILDPEQSVQRKIHEASLAYQLERRYSKERILAGYLNTIYFGNGAYGAQAAAGRYFGTTADVLTLAQAATLAGLIRAPATYDPYTKPDAAQARRNVVLDQMAEEGSAPAAAIAAAKTEPLGVVATPVDRFPAGHFVERVKQFVLDDPAFGASADERRRALFTGGLRIHTTLDLARQGQAEQARDRVLVRPDTDPQAALVSLEPATGFVRALVGGQDFFGTGPAAKFDLATQGRRQPGSSFKPLVLAAALAEGIPLSRVFDAPPRLTLPQPGGQPPWEVENYEGSGGGRMDLVEATVKSVNTVYAQLIMEVGPEAAVDTARRMGVTTSKLDPVPSAVLGSNGVTPLEMTTAYATLANRGLRVEPAFVTRVTRSDGTVVYEHRHAPHRVLPREVADSVVGVLQQAVERGTGVNARIGRPVAGKTGTAQEWRNAWFVGFTPDLVTSVWVGFQADERTSMVPPQTRTRVTGGSWPAQIWQLYSTAALAQTPATAFPPMPTPTGEAGVAPTTTTTPSAPLPVPTVVGLTYDKAAERLKGDGFSVTRRNVPNGDYPPGYVVAQTPRGGTPARSGAAVTLQVSTGRADLVLVPDVLGMTPEEAATVLAAAGLEMESVADAEPPAPGVEGRAGRVWKQSPIAGSEAAIGDWVTVSVNPG